MASKTKCMAGMQKCVAGLFDGFCVFLTFEANGQFIFQFYVISNFSSSRVTFQAIMPVQNFIFAAT